MTRKQPEHEEAGPGERPWKKPAIGTYRHWEEGSQAQGAGLAISLVIIAIAISGYAGDSYGIVAFTALILFALVVLAVSTPFVSVWPKGASDEDSQRD